jgi:hypothetical protein
LPFVQHPLAVKEAEVSQESFRALENTSEGERPPGLWRTVIEQYYQ